MAGSYRAIDPTTREFKLRRGITSHNGEPMDAAAVNFSLDRLLREDVPVLPLPQQVGLCGVNRRLQWKARSDERLEMRTLRVVPATEERR